MCFDVPKVVRSPGCDHGHDEESRNGRDMKIDILDDYIRTPEWFRGLSDIYRSTGGLLEPPRRLVGLMGPIGGRVEAAKGQPRAPPRPSPNWTRRGRPPFPFPFSLLPSPLLLQHGRGSPTPDGSRTPHGVRQGWPAPSPSSTPLYTGREAPP